MQIYARDIFVPRVSVTGCSNLFLQDYNSTFSKNKINMQQELEPVICNAFTEIKISKKFTNIMNSLFTAEHFEMESRQTLSI